MSITNNKLVGKLGTNKIKGSGITVKGETGNGIDRIEKTSSVGLIDTYTIYFTNGTTSNFTIKNGEQGIQGEQGYTPIKGTDYFTEEEIANITQDILVDVNSFDITIVNELPIENIRTKVIYFVLSTEAKEQDVYDEYIYINNQWEHIGSTKVDLTDYYEKEETDEIVNEKAIVDKTTISGKTSQEGTPSPTNIVPIKNVNVRNINIVPTTEEYWEQGSFSSSNGELNESTTRIRTKEKYGILPNETYVCKINNSKYNIVNILFYDNDSNYLTNVTNLLGVSTSSIATEVIFTTPENASLILIAIKNADNTSVIQPDEITQAKLKIEQDTITTTYTPYNYGLLDLNLQKDTDTKTVTLISKRLHEDDSVDENGFHYKKGIYEFTGNEACFLSQTGTYAVFGLTVSGIKQSSRFASNYFTDLRFISQLKENIGIGNNNTVDRVYMSNGISTTASELKSWLAEKYASGTPVTIEYELAEQEDEEFDETNQIAWNTLENLLINSYTFVNSSSDELQPTITLTEYTANEIYRETINKVKEIDTNLTELMSKESFIIQECKSEDNWNDILISGYSSITTIIGSALGIGAPTGAYTYGVLITINPTHSTTETFKMAQIYICDNPSTTGRGIYIRTRYSKNWVCITGSAVSPVTE